MPPLDKRGLRDCQIDAITGLEVSLARADPRALIQMVMGAGKTFTACNFSYRLIKHAGASRILFLVDRNNLGRQTLKEYREYRPPDDGRPFTDLYNVQHLASNRIDQDAKVVITTIQRLYAMLRGEELSEEDEEASAFEVSSDGEKRTVVYNPAIPIETFDFIVTDECHRSIYGTWRQVLEYFDAFIIGLTATPTKHTLGYFRQNLVSEYPEERSVADGINVAHEIYRVKTRVSEQGATVEAGYTVGARDKRTRKVRYEELDDDLTYTAPELDRSVDSAEPNPHHPGNLQAAPLHRAVPRPRACPQDADLRQGRPSRRRNRPGRARGLRQGQRLRQEDHLQGGGRGNTDQGVPHLPQSAHRRYGGHDRHRHRHQAARSADLHARCEVRDLLRADEGACHTVDPGGRSAAGHARTPTPRRASC